MCSFDRDLVGLAREFLKNKEDGRIKLFVTYLTLHYRRDHPALFLEGAYLPCEGRGSKKDHICAFARKSGEQFVLIVVPRLFIRLLQPTTAEIISRVPRMIATTFFSGFSQTPEELPIGDGVWGDSTVVLPDGRADQRYCNVLTGEAVAALKHDGEVVLPLSRVFASFPVALLERSM